ncbi:MULTISPECIES: ABC transporter substrate-binding protein [unclassified Meridianimarinicoccus]|uniref:ABC transporter substrate-binding protein n=1 Tax=unclassified Meridianimarinicoccus TaxID=2923344 RepID=UPI001865CD7B|nr:ABC transporter substrate-binding protein [Fluviibacterium sp. MJW13]
MRARALAVLLGLLAGPAPAQEAVARFAAAQGQADTVLTIRSTTDIVIMAPVLETFVADNPELEIAYEQWGSNALYADSLAACTGPQAVADVVISSGVHQMVDLVNRACASPYRSARTEALAPARRWRDEIWGITQEAAVILYNTRLVSATEVPRTRFALLDLMRRDAPQYHGKIATYDIEASGLGFLFAFMDSQEATTFGGLMEGFNRVEAVATCCSAEIIEGVSEGRYAIAYNVLGSYVDSAPRPDLGVIYPEDYTLFLSRALMIPKGAAQADGATRLLDFLLSPRGQAILAESNLMWRPDFDETGLPSSARRDIPINPTLLVAMDRHRREIFVQKWRATFWAARPE